MLGSCRAITTQLPIYTARSKIILKGREQRECDAM